MNTRFIEASNGWNWGKFMVGQFDGDEWGRTSEVAPGEHLVAGRGWSHAHVLVVDLQTGEGAVFAPWGHARHDLNSTHGVWVCPLFEPFLVWLYDWWQHELHERHQAEHASTFQCDLRKLPAVVQLPDAPSALHGYRRTGGGPVGEREPT